MKNGSRYEICITTTNVWRLGFSGVIGLVSAHWNSILVQGLSEVKSGEGGFWSSHLSIFGGAIHLQSTIYSVPARILVLQLNCSSCAISPQCFLDVSISQLLDFIALVVFSAATTHSLRFENLPPGAS